MAVYYINATSNSGATFGQSGYFYPLYLTATEANSASDNSAGTSHTHTFEEAPNITFYMPVEDAQHAQSTAPTGNYSGEAYVSYLSPIAETEILDIGQGVLAGDTFDTWRKKTNDVGRETIANKALVNAVDTRVNRILTTTGGEENIVTITSDDAITGEKDFQGIVKFTAADDLSNAVLVGTDGKFYVSSSEFKFNKTIDLHTAGAKLKTSELDIPTGKTKYNNITYTWPNTPPTPGQILKVGTSNSLSWATEQASQANVEAFVVEDPNPIGSILQWPTTEAPTKWLLCNGQDLNTYTYRDLHAVISNTYGGTAYNAGVTDQNGVSTTFKAPNFQGRVPVGLGVSTDNNNLEATFNTIGATSFTSGGTTIHGNYKHLLDVTEMPEHTHTITAKAPNHDVDSISSQGYPYQDVHNSFRTSDRSRVRTLHPDAVTAANTGGDTAHNNVQPFITINYIIKWQSSAIATQNITPGDGLLINGSTGQSNLLVVNASNTITMNVDTSDFDFSAGGALQTKYKAGEIIETFNGQCGIFTNADGTTPTNSDTITRTVLSGTYRMPSLGASSSTTMVGRVPTNSGEMFGGIQYKRIAGVKYIKYQFKYTAARRDANHIWSHMPVVITNSSKFTDDNVDVPTTSGSAADHNDLGNYWDSGNGVRVLLNFIQGFAEDYVGGDSHENCYTIECVDTAQEENLTLGKVHWPVDSIYQLGTVIRLEHDTNNEPKLFNTYYMRTEAISNSTQFCPPSLTITATAG